MKRHQGFGEVHASCSGERKAQDAYKSRLEKIAQRRDAEEYFRMRVFALERVCRGNISQRLNEHRIKSGNHGQQDEREYDELRGHLLYTHFLFFIST
jgi:hypothetical protein